MQLIRGQTLAEMIAELRGLRKPPISRVDAFPE